MPGLRHQVKHVWLLAEVPATVRSTLNLLDRDFGIASLRKRRLANFAVQCKYREDERLGLTWSELSTFTGLAFGVPKNITFALVAYNGDWITKVLDASANTGFIASDRWHGLGADFGRVPMYPQSGRRRSYHFLRAHIRHGQSIRRAHTLRAAPRAAS